MTDHFYRAQGSISPSMFLGVGGVGSRIVDRLAGRAEELPNWETQLQPLTTFVSIDTNELDQHRLEYIPEGNRLNIAAFDKAKVVEHYRRSQDKQALQWLDRGYQPRPGFKPGAGQIRVESRLGFFYHSSEIRARLDQLIQGSLRPGIAWRKADPPRYNAYVFCTLAGGTGSGSFLPLAYLVSGAIAAQHWQPRVISNLLLSTLMLEKVGRELHPDIHANTYAALKELEHLTKLDYSQVKREGREAEPFVFQRDENAREITTVSSRPFFISFIFDRPPHLGLPQTDAAIADAAFLQIFTPIMDNLAGEYDNYEKNLEELTRFPGELKNLGQGFTKNFGVYGAAAMVLPATELLEYSALRFAAQAIRSQITFGVDPTNPDDDRARALARLAVDYSDAKFLRMADEGRERAINESFVVSVQEMARQDEHEELLEGFWYRLVESVDRGRLTGHDEKDQPVRSESLLDTVRRKMDSQTRDLLNRVSIRERTFVFHKEGVGQYIELVSRLREETRKAQQVVDEGVRTLETAASEGELVTDLKLDPITERYLVLRLLSSCEGEWIPEAKSRLDKAEAADTTNPKVRERLEKELYDSLQDAASERRLFGKKDQVFVSARDEAQDYYRGVAMAARRRLEAEVRLRLLRSLLEYLRGRARQYARLATRMDSLVQDLERDAERLRRKETSVELPLALRVEVFETLEEPATRVWHQVYHSLFLDRGRYISTYDRQILAEAIARELKPVVREDGSVATKSIDETVKDLRRSLLRLGRRRLRGSIKGGDGEAGLDLAAGLELEGRLILRDTKQPGEEVTDEELKAYRDRKFQALHQLAGVLARVSTAESKALDDGVKSAKTRQLIVGLDASAGGVSEEFVDRLTNVLSAGGRQVKVDSWNDPRLAIVHDVVLPIPLYYVEPVTAEVEDAYLRLAADERRTYHLHTAYRWEKSLPNLNPRRSEITIGWSLERLADGLLTGLFANRDGSWLWLDDDEPMELGSNLSGTLYRIGQIHRQEVLRKSLEEGLEKKMGSLDDEVLRERKRRLAELIGGLMKRMEKREMAGDMTQEDWLDGPILRALTQMLESRGDAKSSIAYDQLKLD